MLQALLLASSHLQTLTPDPPTWIQPWQFSAMMPITTPPLILRVFDTVNESPQQPQTTIQNPSTPDGNVWRAHLKYGPNLNLLSTLDPCSPPNCTAHGPMPHHMITVSANLKTTPESVSATQPDYLHSTPHPDNLLPGLAVPPGLLLPWHIFCNQPSPQHPSLTRIWSGPNPLLTADAQQCHRLKIVFVHPNLPLVNLISIHWTIWLFGLSTHSPFPWTSVGLLFCFL